MATRVSMLGARCQRLLNPLTKKRWLMTITMAASSSWVSPMATWLPERKAGRGKPHMPWPMDTYMRTSRKPRDKNSRFLSFGVSLSRRASSASAREG